MEKDYEEENKNKQNIPENKSPDQIRIDQLKEKGKEIENMFDDVEDVDDSLENKQKNVNEHFENFIRENHINNNQPKGNEGNNNNNNPPMENLNINNELANQANQMINNNIVNLPPEENHEENLIEPRQVRQSAQLQQNYTKLKSGLLSLGFKEITTLNKRDMGTLEKYNVHNMEDLLNAVTEVRNQNTREQRAMADMRESGFEPTKNDNPSKAAVQELDKITSKITTGQYQKKEDFEAFIREYNRIYQEHVQSERSENEDYLAEERILKETEFMLKEKGIPQSFINVMKDYGNPESHITDAYFKINLDCSTNYFNNITKQQTLKNYPAPSSTREADSVIHNLLKEPNTPLDMNTLKGITSMMHKMSLHNGALPPSERGASLATYTLSHLTEQLQKKGIPMDMIDMMKLDEFNYGEKKGLLENHDFNAIKDTKEFLMKANREIELNNQVTLGADKCAAKFYAKIGELFKADVFDKGDEINKDNLLPAMKMLREMKDVGDKFTKSGNNDAKKFNTEREKMEKFLRVKGLSKDQIKEIYDADESKLEEIANKDLGGLGKEAGLNAASAGSIKLVIKDGENQKEIDVDTTKRLRIVVDLNEMKATIEEQELFDEVKPMAKEIGLGLDNKDDIKKDVKEEEEDMKPLLDDVPMPQE